MLAVAERKDPLPCSRRWRKTGIREKLPVGKQTRCENKSVTVDAILCVTGNMIFCFTDGTLYCFTGNVICCVSGCLPFSMLVRSSDGYTHQLRGSVYAADFMLKQDPVRTD